MDAIVEEQLGKKEAEIRAKAEEKAFKKVTEDQALTMKALEQERDEKTAALKKAQDDQLSLLAEKRKLQEAKDQLVIDGQKALEAEREKIRQELQQQVEEASRVKMAEREAALKKANDDQALTLKALEQERDEKIVALKKSQEEQLDLLAEKRKLQEDKDQLAIDSQKALEAEREKIRQELQQQVEEAGRAKMAEREAALKKANEDQALTLKALEQERDEKTIALKKAQQDQLDLLAEKRKLLEDKDQLVIDNQKKLDEEREKLREDLQKQADDTSRLKIAEKEKVISDLNTRLQEAQRKAAQGSMQTQGEVLEQDFEQRLRQAFPIDQIEPVSTGTRGADIAQEVVSRTGQRCGIILIETKRTKAWQDAWTSKLRGDMRTARADIGLIVTETLPKDIDRFGMKDGVWITDYASALPLVHSLRVTLQEVTIAKGHREGAKEKMELLYEYLTGNEFRHRVQLVIEAFRSMKTELDKERTYLTTKWNKREKQINLVIESMAGMVGDVQALSGSAALLNLEDSDDDELENEDDAGESAA
ncbi:MAG: DUF2130 domain-containing protein [Luteolibacter sp.]|nr:DUF2130 domain-containing protein [Luteolibacter sp.]